MAKEPENADQMKALQVSGDREGPTSVLIGDQKFKVKQQVNVPVLKHESGVTVAVRMEQPIRHELSQREIEVLNSATGEMVKGKQETQISVARVTELGSNQLFNLVLNAITASEFERAYPENGYVGKSFAIRKLGVVAGKRYKDVQIVEIEPELAAAAE